MNNDIIDGSNGMILDGIFASQVWDSSGEVLDIEGCDISEMIEGRGLANYEHRNDESTGATSQDIVGKIVFAKKIMQESDATDDRQKMFWKKIKVPFIYGMVRLYDGAGHLSAQGLAAQVRDAVKNKEQILVRFSIDGSTLERDGNKLKRTIARRVALTIKPCNKTCDSDLVVDPNAPEGYEKKPKKPIAELVKKEHPLYGRLGSSGEIEQDAAEQQTLWKALKASKEPKPAAKKPVLPKPPKPPKQWESEDGVVIPRAGTPDRKRWDGAYEKALKQHFGGGKKITIDVDSAQNLNPIKNYDRYAMYVQMAQHDKLPPAVVRRSGAGGWDIVDGNHRHFAAKKVGLKTMDAIDISQDKMKKSAAWESAGFSPSDYARKYEDQRHGENEGSHADYEWSFHPSFPIDKVHDHRSYPKDLETDRYEWWKENNGPFDSSDDFFAALKTGKAQDPYSYLHDAMKQEPIVVVQRRDNGAFTPWDGAHRIGAAVEKQMPNLPAVVGRFKVTKSHKAQETGMKKAMDAGMATGSPSSLMGGAALQREELAKKLVKLAQEYHESKGSMRDFLKSQLPEVSDNYLDHFTDLATDIRAKLRKAEPLAKARKKAGMAPPKAPEPEMASPDDESNIDAPIDEGESKKKVSEMRFTAKGQPVPMSGLSRQEIHFNEHTGELKTKRGVFHAYNPDNDGKSGELFRKVWNSPEVRKQHDYAVGNWIKVNQALKQGRLPQAVLATATAFSQLSPNTPVPVHEMMYAYLLDTFKNKGFDVRSPHFASEAVKQDWTSRDKPHSYPISSSDYFSNNINSLISLKNPSVRTGRQTGERPSFMLANNKFDNMAQYANVHHHLVDLVSRHGVDARSAVKEMMDGKVHAEKWESRRKAATNKGKADVGPYQGLNIPGLAPKTARFTYSMLGAGNSFVPDTHFSRHFFGLEKGVDGDSISHLRNDVMWNPQNSELLNGFDRWYYRNHPAVKLMMEHPEYGSYFKDNPEQAVFPAFWGHWLSIAPHEALLGHRKANVASNQAASHRPLFDEVDRLMSDPKEAAQTIPARTTPLPESPAPVSRLFFPPTRKSEDSGPLIDPRLAAALVRHWINHHGEEEASFRYYSQLVPLLMHGSENEDPILKAEKLSVEVRNAAAQLKKANGNPTEAAPTRGEGPADSSRHSLGLAQEADLVGKNPKHIAPVKVSAADGNDRINNTPEQKALIDGVDLSRNLKAKPVHATESLTSPTQMWIPHPDGKRLVLVKHGHEWSYPHMGARETAYHNLARDVFGLGEYVPLTAMANHPGGWEMSMQEMVKNPEHHNSGSAAHLKTLMRLGDAGELHKLAAMNYILGNDDRHGNNYLFSRGDDGKLSLKLIDHGHTFRNTEVLHSAADKKLGLAPDYQPRELRKPHYLKVYEFEKARPAAQSKGRVAGRVMMDPKSSPVHPDAVEWLRNLNGPKLRAEMEGMGLGNRAVDGVMRDFYALRDSWTKPGATTDTPMPWTDREIFESKDFAPAGQELHSDEPEDWQRSDWSGMKSASTSGPTWKMKKADNEDAHDDEECSECGTDHVHIGAYIVEHCHHEEGSHLCIYDEKTGEKIAETDISKDLDDALDKADKPFHGYNKNRHSRSGGLSDSYREKVNREEGSNLKRPVTGKVEPGSKAAKRRKSFCARMSGVKGPTSKEGKLTPKGAALKRWKCSKGTLEKSADEGLATLSKAELLRVLQSLGVAPQTSLDILRPKDKV